MQDETTWAEIELFRQLIRQTDNPVPVNMSVTTIITRRFSLEWYASALFVDLGMTSIMSNSPNRSYNCRCASDCRKTAYIVVITKGQLCRSWNGNQFRCIDVHLNVSVFWRAHHMDGSCSNPRITFFLNFFHHPVVVRNITSNLGYDDKLIILKPEKC